MITKDQFMLELGKRVERAGSQKALAEELGFSTQYLNDILQGHREPSYDFAEAMGYKRLVMYEKTR